MSVNGHSVLSRTFTAYFIAAAFAAIATTPFRRAFLRFLKRATPRRLPFSRHAIVISMLRCRCFRRCSMLPRLLILSMPAAYFSMIAFAIVFFDYMPAATPLFHATIFCHVCAIDAF